MEKELTAAVTTQEPMLADRLIVVQQLPVIKEQLHSIKAQAQASVAEALALVCTEETLKAVKDRRAALTRDRKDLDARRMVVKNQIMPSVCLTKQQHKKSQRWKRGKKYISYTKETGLTGRRRVEITSLALITA